MAALREMVRWYNDEIQDGICWVAVWKRGRSWDAEAFYPEDGSYGYGYVFAREDMERMQDIITIDPAAVMLNGYFCNVGTDENRRVPVGYIVRGIEWNYYNRYNQLLTFTDCMIIK